MIRFRCVFAPGAARFALIRSKISIANVSVIHFTLGETIRKFFQLFLKYSSNGNQRNRGTRRLNDFNSQRGDSELLHGKVKEFSRGDVNCVRISLLFSEKMGPFGLWVFTIRG